jgi:hypothetical protein
MTTKKNYQFSISQKVMIWVTETHIVEAENKEQAIKIMSDNFEDNNKNTIVKQEFEFDTIEHMYPEGNALYPTRLLYDDNEKKLLDNEYN